MLTPDEAIGRAIAAAGSDDFGQEGWRDGLERSLAAFTTMPLTEDAAHAVNDKIVADLANRLRIEQWFAQHPELADEVIEAPVFVVGMPRTGTTATVAMLALDERFRFLRSWEGNSPVPPPVLAEEASDPRAVALRETAKTYAMSHMHLFDPDGPEEDLALLAGLDMHSYHGAYPMPDDYVAWWLAEPFETTYAYLHKTFRLLQSRRPPNTWLVKSPPHLFRLDVIARHFPDARFVMTHRDPGKLIASVASLHHTLHEQRCLPGSVDKAWVGPRLLAFWREGMERALRARAAIGKDRFVDVRNDEVVSAPHAVFERIYDHLGMSLNAALRDRLADYNNRNAPGKFGSHSYTLEEYGLTRRDIDKAFGSYIERFGL